MSPSIATFGAGALLIATSLFPAPVTADIHHSVHRIHRRHFRRSGLPSGWSTRGCITDSEASRVLSAHQTDTTLTTASCIKSCAASGYKFAGTQFGQECWCGSSLNTAVAGNSASGGCNMPCAGDATQTCGGNYRMNLYSLSSGSSTTSSAPYSAPTSSGKKYTIKDKYAGQSFFDGWSFFDYADPTNGQVDYLSKSDATSAGLAYVQSDGVAVLKVDNTTTLAQGQPRKSVRIQSNNQYSSGLFVADILHMPFGCSVWPAFWTVGDNWPNNGEIDILENVNLATTNQYTLHTGSSSTCTLDSNPIAKFKATSNMMGKTCASKEGDNAGCGFADPDSASYGQGFNDAGGAVLAMEWQSTGIRIWRFKRDSIPADLQGDAASPNPDTWGSPVAAWSSATCDIANQVKKHTIVINTTLCGGWAGDAYATSGCPGTCSDRIMNPSNFDNAVWKIKSVAVYQ
ncbi:glycosidase C21B10,07 [Ceratobasidium theobromae]|uniref:Glycosidase C21B10,07 n=1 Tax=Ceratobasidium theobromae TaxID=1582974 RepID=A0A5N5QQT7_9AGAM|nr:glycosidase C21B10,07 [Ceratobasidium theobromae]